MGEVSRVWEKITNERADELCKALIRMPLMTYKQVANLLSVGPTMARRIVKHSWNIFTEHPYRERYISPRYTIGSRNIKTVIGLSESAFEEWGSKEGIQSRRMVKGEDVDRVLSVSDLLVKLRLKHVLYDKWDLMLPQEGTEGLHGWLKRVSDGHRLGLYLLPTRYNKEATNKNLFFMQRGIIRRVTQNIHTEETLFLVPTEQYEMTLRLMTKITTAGVSLFLLPIESFLTHPSMYLNAIIDRDVQGFNDIVNHIQLNDRLFVPGQYEYRALGRVAPDTYRFVDVYANGSIDRIRSWSQESNKIAYNVPETGAAATAWVYAYDKVLEDGLRAVLKHDRSIVEVNPWPVTTIGRLSDDRDGDWSFFDDAWDTAE